MPDLLPDSARIDGGTLTLGGLDAPELAEEHGTPLVVLCEETIRARARALRAAVGDGRVFFGAKAFPNVALLRLLREEGIGADVAAAASSRSRAQPGLTGDELVVHGNNKDARLPRPGGTRGRSRRARRARTRPSWQPEAGVERVLVRVTLGVDADTHEAIRTGHHGSKFGLPPDQARALVADALDRGLDVLGVHVHVGSQLADFDAQAETIVRLAAFAARCRDELGWVARVADLGGGFGIRHHPGGRRPRCGELATSAATTARTAFLEAGCPSPSSGSSPAGAWSAGRASPSIASAASSGSPDGRGSRSTAACPTTRARSSTTRATRRSRRTGSTEPGDEVVSVAGMHCESGDVLIDDVALPSPRRGDLLAVPATGAYTLAMASNYNGVTRPAAVLVRDGSARVIRRRETIDDLLRHEAL